MRRHPALIPLSRDHHDGLVQAVRLRRAAAEGDASARLAARERARRRDRPTTSTTLTLDGLAIREACCVVGAAGGVSGAVRVSAGARERAAVDNQVFLAYRTTI